MNNKYAFFLDIDGTVYNDGVICRKNREAIKLARSLGHYVFINTARSFGNIPRKVKNLKVDGFVTGLGTSVIINGEKIKSTTFPKEEIESIFDYLNGEGLKFIFEGEDFSVCNKLLESDDILTVESGKDMLSRIGSHAFAKAFIPGRTTEKQQEYLKERYSFFQHKNYAEFSIKGYSKATGIEAVIKHLGIDKSHCVAMGDSLNDESMLKFAGISVAMGDGDEEIKNMCDIITCDADKGGVAQGILSIINTKVSL